MTEKMPRAYSIVVGECGFCEWPHIILYDEHGEPICDATVGDITLKRLQETRERIRGRGRLRLV